MRTDAEWKTYLNGLAPGAPRMLGFADYLETRKHHAGVALENKNACQTEFFTLNRYRFQCGAPACIAGHAGFIGMGVAEWMKLPMVYQSSHNVVKWAREWLGLEETEEAWGQLFEPNLSTFQYNSITPTIAAEAIRRFVVGARSKSVLWAKVYDFKGDDNDAN